MSVDDFFAEFPELANARVTFGLSEKKRQRCAELLEQGKEWPEIARDVGWECETLKRYYYRVPRTIDEYAELLKREKP